MPFICEDCTNKTSFRKIIWGRASYTETEFFDENGEGQDWDDCEYEQLEQTGSDEEECTECGGSIRIVSEQEWDNWNGPDEIKIIPKNWKKKIGVD